MNDTPQGTPAGAPDGLERFPSLSALRAAHGRLLKRQFEIGETDELLAEVEGFIEQGRATGALLDAEDDRWASQGLLDYWVAVLYRADREPPDATLADFDPLLAPELDDAACPYVGLDAFGEADHQVFYGRGLILEELVARLQEGQAGGRLLAVVGPSGSGKSSLVLGGLLPALKEGAVPGSEGWRYCRSIVPGSAPLANLARLFVPDGAEAAVWIQRQAARFQEDTGHLARLAGTEEGRPAVLLVDQFEEIFTLCNDAQVRQAFTDNLLGLLQARGAAHVVVLTMRSDFEPHVAALPAFHEVFERALVRVPPLSASELREAIVKPAESVGLKFEQGVVDALLEDILGEPTALPLLQFTLLKLWEERERNRVTWEAYRHLGGGRQALANVADEFYEGLIPEDQVVVRYILLRMVRPSEGLEVTSSRIRRRALYRAGPAPYLVDRVLDRLLEARLVRLTEGETPDDDQVEVAHEALVRNWPRLVAWLEEERVAMTTRRRLEARAAEWERLGRSGAGLLDEVQLWEAEQWLASADAERLGYAEALPALVQASRAALDQARQEREAARQREVAQAQALAEAERRRAEQEARSARRLRWLVGGLALCIIVALILAAAAFLAQQTANANAAEAATKQSLADANAAEAATKQSLADANAATAIQAQGIAQAAATDAAAKQAVAVDALATLDVQLKNQLEAAPAPTATPSPTATPAGAESATPGPSLTPTLAPSPTENREATSTAVALATQRASVQATQTAVAIQPLGGEGLVQMTHDPTDEYCAALSPDQRTLLVQSNRTGPWHIWATDPEGNNWRQLTTKGTANFQARFAPDGRQIIFASDMSGDRELYTMAPDGSALQQLTFAAGADSYPSYSGDGAWIVFMSEREGTWGVYTMRPDGSELRVVIDTTADETFPFVSPDGKQIVFQSDAPRNWEIYTISMDGGQPARLTSDPARDANPVFTPDGKRIVFETSRDGDYEIYVMNADGSNPRNLTNAPKTREQIPAVSPDGRWMLFQSTLNGNWDIFRIPLPP